MLVESAFSLSVRSHTSRIPQRSRQSASQAFALFRSVTLGRRRLGKQLKLKANWKNPLQVHSQKRVKEAEAGPKKPYATQELNSD